MNFSEKLKLIRNTRNITQEQLADRLGISRQSISNWESGVAYPETEKLLKLSKELNISLDYLLLDENDLDIKLQETPKTVICVPSGSKIGRAHV